MRLIIFFVFALSISCSRQAPVPAGTILTNGRIFTGGDPKFAEAIAIAGDRILAVGSNAEITARAGSATRRVNLGGRLVIPGINDAHVHLDIGLPPHVALKLEGMDPPCSAVLVQVKSAAASVAADKLIVGEIGPSAFFDPGCNANSLDRIAPRHAAILYTWSGHAAIVSRAAVRRFQLPVTKPEGGFFGKDMKAAAWDGVIHEYARYRLAPLLNPQAADAEFAGQIAAFLDQAKRFGITSIQVMSPEPDRLVRLLSGLDLPLHVRVITFPRDGAAQAVAQPARRISDHIAVSGLKLILDGTPVERSMAMREAYRDDPGGSGQMNLPAESIRSAIGAAVRSSDPLLLHAVGDRAIDSILRIMETSGTPDQWPGKRLRIEHGDGLMPDLTARAKTLGVVVVQNPSHLTLPALMTARLGPDRAAKMQPLKSLVEAGIPVALGSDGPLNPFLNIMLAVTHPHNPAEALSREQAISAYTRWAAFAEFTEQDKGVLEPGKKADLAVLSQDILDAAPGALPNTTSVLTMTGGRIVHQAF